MGRFSASWTCICGKRESPRTAQTARRGDASVKTQRNASQREHSTILPFPGSHYSKPHISMNEGTAAKKNDMLSFLEGDVLHGLQYSKWCYYLWPLHSVIPLSSPFPGLAPWWWRRSFTSPCYLHVAVIILRAPSPFTFILIFYNIYD